jgi:two-component system, NarL family, invasion response regulator UvrY
MALLRVVVADDHPLIRIGLAEVLTADRDIAVKQTASIAELREVLATEIPDVLVLDLNMPSGNSLDVIPELKRLHPKLAILVLSIHPEQLAGVKAILAGANGYLHKGSAPEQLLIAVRQVATGGRYVSHELGAALAEYLFRGQTDRLPHETLSEREYTVLVKIAEGYTTAEIAEQLNLSPKTVGTYRSRVLEKMGISTTAELTRYVVEKGLREDQE